MRLGEILSEPIIEAFKPVDGFLDKTSLKKGKQKKLNIGKISINYFCKDCNQIRTFVSTDDLYAIGINKNRISIDCVLTDEVCKNTIEAWFLIESKNDIHDYIPEVRIIKRSEKVNDRITIIEDTDTYKNLFERSEIAYQNNLGAGSIIYLRKIYEQITVKVATATNTSLKTPKNKPRPFKEVLQEVNEKHRIIPTEFTNNKYKLFGELSNIIHGSYDEELALNKYKSFKRLVLGIVETVKNNKEIIEAMSQIGLKGGTNE